MTIVETEAQHRFLQGPDHPMNPRR